MYNENLTSLKLKLFLSAVLLLIAIAMPFLMLKILPMINTSETSAAWFQRSGSLVVLFAALSEYMMFKTYDYISPTEAAFSVPFDTPKWYRQLYNLLSYIGLITLVVGTLIWGYGDYFII